MVQRHLLRNKKLYVVFIDFRKAFDFILHCKLWPILNKTGIKGNFLQTIQNMYRFLFLLYCSGCIFYCCIVLFSFCSCLFLFFSPFFFIFLSASFCLVCLFSVVC